MSAGQSLASIAVPLTLVSRGASVQMIGTVSAVATLVTLIQMVAAAALADRGFLRSLLTILPLASAVGSVPFVTGSSLAWIGAGAVAGGFSGGSGATSGNPGAYQPVEYAWIARTFPDRDRNRMVSRFSATSVAGVVVASILALRVTAVCHAIGLSTAGTDQDRVLMMAVGVFALLGSVLGLFITPETGSRSRRGHQQVSIRRLAGTIWPRRSGKLLLQLSAVGVLNGIAVGSYGSFVTVLLIVRFHVTATQLGLLNLVIATVAVGGDLAAPGIAKRLGLVRAVIITRVVQSLVILPIAFVPSLTADEILLVIRQVAQRLNQPLRDSYTLAQSDPAEKARVSALSNIANRGMQAVSNEVSGEVIAASGFGLPFVVAAFAQLAGGLLFFGMFARNPPPEESCPAGARRGETVP